MCLGTIAQAVTSKISRNGSNGALRVKRTVCGSGASAVSMRWRMARARGFTSMWNFMIENTTSSDVKSRPSCHFTPCSSVKV